MLNKTIFAKLQSFGGVKETCLATATDQYVFFHSALGVKSSLKPSLASNKALVGQEGHYVRKKRLHFMGLSLSFPLHFHPFVHTVALTLAFTKLYKCVSSPPPGWPGHIPDSPN